MENNNNKCRFCDVWDGIFTYPTFDKPIIKNDQYMSIVSIGAFIEGWSLVIPKEHTYSMRAFYAQKGFREFVSCVAQHIKNIYNSPVIVFEHGANCCNSETSCGTHHAHLHIVPYDKSLLPTIVKDRHWQKVSCNQIHEVVGEQEYLLYSDLNETLETSDIYVHILTKGESQYFRRILANDSHVLDYSYKTAPYIDQTIKSYEMLKGND